MSLLSSPMFFLRGGLVPEGGMSGTGWGGGGRVNRMIDTRL